MPYDLESSRPAHCSEPLPHVAAGDPGDQQLHGAVITSYSIHYTKLYERPLSAADEVVIVQALSGG